jgi:hypothetical protein
MEARRGRMKRWQGKIEKVARRKSSFCCLSKVVLLLKSVRERNEGEAEVWNKRLDVVGALSRAVVEVLRKFEGDREGERERSELEEEKEEQNH